MPAGYIDTEEVKKQCEAFAIRMERLAHLQAQNGSFRIMVAAVNEIANFEKYIHSLLPGQEEKEEMNQTEYQKRKKLSVLEGELDSLSRQRENAYVEMNKKREEIARLQTEIQIEAASTTSLKKTKDVDGFEQYEFTGIVGTKYRIQLRDPRSGNVVSSLYCELK